MKVRIVRVTDDYELNIRDTDEVGEDEGMTDNEIDIMESYLRRTGRYYLDMDRVLFPVR